ncbi:DinB family protein [Maribacter hydrothermalis]|uniref:Metal-dependent hydrolase n=1 Tax=Maribacter hydrothermalis TaxID=1836467 RepID=A0A1B7Z1Z9_9FLAO|nr:DinB family protein [Maribacter hydrothermalis]APQ19360.1 metal-dependent hydrolase [Maribacter hydrothermalis]OBR36757.1 metal-dependent hydrolase [Maribacter hydrothermalis]
MENEEYEYWLSGPLPGVPDLLQPAAHALLQSERELKKYTADFPKELLWAKTAGRASVGFHMNHITGVLDRMMTYAKGESLSDEQFQFLKKEGVFNLDIEIADLQEQFSAKVAEALIYFKTIPEASLTEKRTVGRKKLPSTVIGLLFHAAEHNQRHIGQLLVTVSVLKDRS